MHKNVSYVSVSPDCGRASMNSVIAASNVVKVTKGRLDHTAAGIMGHFSTTLPKIFTKSP